MKTKKTKATATAVTIVNVTPTMSPNMSSGVPADIPSDIPHVEAKLPLVRVAVDSANGRASLVPVDPDSFEAQLTAAPKLVNARAIFNYVRPWYATRDQEAFLVLLFNIRHGLRGVAEIATGQRSHVGIGLDDLVRVVTVAGAERFVVTHNHPSGVATPSDPDKRLTKQIRAAFSKFDNLLFEDHVIVGRDEFYSFYEKKPFKG